MPKLVRFRYNRKACEEAYRKGLPLPEPESIELSAMPNMTGALEQVAKIFYRRMKMMKREMLREPLPRPDPRSGRLKLLEYCFSIYLKFTTWKDVKQCIERPERGRFNPGRGGWQLHSTTDTGEI